MNCRSRRGRIAACGLLLILLVFFLFRSFHTGGPPSVVSPPTDVDGTPQRPPTPAAQAPPALHPALRALEPDADSHWDTLANGFRFVIQPRPLPPGRISLRLLVQAGSLMEADDQRGVAHFVEHMAFNGTRNFPPLEAFERFERLGMGRGTDTNASTDFDHTIYKLDLPATDEDTLAEAFLFLRDVADGILFSPDEVESERKVILSEARERRQRSDGMTRIWEGMVPESLLARRAPIGLDEIIENAPLPRLVDFYRTYYTARRMILVVVGDCEYGDIRTRTEKSFGSLPDLPRVDDPDLGPLTLERGVVACKSLPLDFALCLGALHAVDREPDSRERRLRELALELANKTADYRRREDSTRYNLTATRWREVANFAAAEVMSAYQGQNSWQRNVSVLAEEWRSLRDFGFTTGEFAIGRTAFLQSAVSKAMDRLRMENRKVADDIVESLVRKRIHLSPEDEFSLALVAFREVTKADAEAAWREAWDSEDVCLFLPADTEIDQNEDPLDYLERGWAQALPPPEDKALPEVDLTAKRNPGEVIARETFEDVGVTVVTFRNEVRLNFRKIGTVAGVYEARVSYGRGLLSTPPGGRGIGNWAGLLFVQGGLPEANSYDLRRATAGAIMECRFKAGYDAFHLSGTGTSDVMGRHLALMAARLTRTDWKEGERLQRLSPRSLSLIASKWDDNRDLDAVLRRTLIPSLAGWDARVLAPTSREIFAHSAEEVEQWHRPAALDEPLEITIVGDVSLAYAERMVAETFGALPHRRAVRPEVSELHPGKPGVKGIAEFPFRSRDRSEAPLGDKAACLIQILPLKKHCPPAEERKLDVLARILEGRLNREIRESLGETYGCSVAVQIHPDLGGLSYLMVSTGGKASRLEAISTAVRNLAADLAVRGATKDERERALRPLLSTVELQERDPGYWLTVLDRCGRYPRGLDDARNARRYLKEAALADLNGLARQYLDPARVREFRYVPEE
jgi:zinc protease